MVNYPFILFRFPVYPLTKFIQKTVPGATLVEEIGQEIVFLLPGTECPLQSVNQKTFNISHMFRDLINAYQPSFVIAVVVRFYVFVFNLIQSCSRRTHYATLNFTKMFLHIQMQLIPFLILNLITNKRVFSIVKSMRVQMKSNIYHVFLTQG